MIDLNVNINIYIINYLGKTIQGIHLVNWLFFFFYIKKSVFINF